MNSEVGMIRSCLFEHHSSGGRGLKRRDDDQLQSVVTGGWGSFEDNGPGGGGGHGEGQEGMGEKEEPPLLFGEEGVFISGQKDRWVNKQ